MSNAVRKVARCGKFDPPEVGQPCKARFPDLRFGSVVQTDNTATKEVTMAASAITVQQLTDAISKQWPEAELVEKKAYHRIALDKLTLGYAYLRGVRPAVEVTKGDGSGKYDYIGIKTKADLNRAISSMKKVEAKASKKAAAAAKRVS